MQQRGDDSKGIRCSNGSHGGNSVNGGEGRDGSNSIIAPAPASTTAMVWRDSSNSSNGSDGNDGAVSNNGRNSSNTW